MKTSNKAFKQKMLRLKNKKRDAKKYPTYKDYLLSKEWKALKNKKLRYAKHKCEDCGSKEFLQVHHKTYKRIFREKFIDLIVLCDICHKQKHNLLTEEEIEAKANDLFRTQAISS